jgi:RNA polymerase sigma factor (sigma-70 family)
MRLPVWKRKMTIGQAIAQESSEGVQDTTRQGTFLRLMAQYEPALWRLTTGYAEQRADREDLFQEIAVGLWQAIPRFRGDASERTWLYRIAHNIAITHAARRRSRGSREEPIPEDTDFASRAIDSEQQVLSSESRTLLAQAIRSLPTLDRQIVLLHLEGLNYAQIEEVSGLSQSAIASRLSRLRDRLKDIILKTGRASDAQ